MTDDWVALTLFRYCPSIRRPNEPPVLLVHGGGSTHLAWDLGDGIGFAPWLAGRGHEVWTLDLRGRKRSPRARKLRTMGWTLDHLIEFDLPGAIRRIGELTRSGRVHYVGHSMGGMLGYCYLIRFEGQGIGRVATLGSPAFLGHLPASVGALQKVVEWFMPALPLATLARLAAPLLTWFPRRWVRGAVNLENVEAGLVRRYLRHGVASLPARKALHLSKMLRAGGLVSADGRLRYVDQLHRIRTPIFVGPGSIDGIAGPAQCLETLRRLGSEEKVFRLFGRASGDAADYSHADLLWGHATPREVYPAVEALLWKEPPSASDRNAGGDPSPA